MYFGIAGQGKAQHESEHASQESKAAGGASLDNNSVTQHCAVTAKQHSTRIRVGTREGQQLHAS
jgi:hypothetical protein